MIRKPVVGDVYKYSDAKGSTVVTISGLNAADEHDVYVIVNHGVRRVNGLWTTEYGKWELISPTATPKTKDDIYNELCDIMGVTP